MKKKIRALFGSQKPLFRAWPKTWGEVFLLVGLSVAVAVVINLTWGQIPSEVTIGSIAQQDIRADRDYEILDEAATQTRIQEAVSTVLPVYDWDEDLTMIIENPEDLEPYKDKGIMIRPLHHPEMTRGPLKDFSGILGLEEARRQSSQKFAKNGRLNAKTREERMREVRPNLFYNDAETQLQKKQAAKDVRPVLIPIQAGESIVRIGDHFEPRHLTILEGIRREKERRFSQTRFLGSVLFGGLFLTIVFFVLGRSARKITISFKDFLFFGTLLLTVIGLERIFLFIFSAVRVLMPIDIPLQSLYGLLPVAYGTLVVRMVLPLPITVAFALLSSILAGFVVQGSWNYTLYYLVGCILAMELVSHVRTRGQLLGMGLRLGMLNALAILTFDMVNVTSITGVVSLQDSGIRVALAFIGGFLNAFLAMILMPLVETVFNYLTPIKLLEYGSLNHPLLREMIVRAPGTYHHSHMVGTLAETACEAIGADSLFARVASYFHDIGKMKKSSYFIENMSASGVSPTEDKHASLAPSMSVLIITSHVKDGIEMAREHKLPQKIIDIIPQHQGTKLISYFYNKAKEQEDRDMHVVSENDYRYAGPKPQSREAGVILLADTVEAATRALKDRSVPKVEEVVRNMINKNFIDGQLDECELTLKDLHLIAKSFVRILMGIYHQRIEYPVDPQEKMAREMSAGETNADKFLQQKPFSPDSKEETTGNSKPPLRRIS